jgi:hypothetical protein
MADTTTTTTMTTTTNQPSAAIISGVVGQFTDMLTQFFEAMSDTFPECPHVQIYSAGWSVKLESVDSGEEKLALGVEAIVGYHESMEPYYARCTSRDTSMMGEDIEFMQNLALNEKWSGGLHPETEEAVWCFLDKLNEYSNIYDVMSSIPGGMMGSVEGMALSVAHRIQHGEMSLANMDLTTLTQEIMSSISESDMAEFIETIKSGKGIGNIQNLLSIAISIMSTATE